MTPLLSGGGANVLEEHTGIEIVIFGKYNLPQANSNISVYSLLVSAFCNHPKRSLATTSLQRYSSVFSSRCYIVLTFIFRSVIHLSWINCVRSKVNVEVHFIFHTDIQLIQHHMLERHLFNKSWNQLTMYVWGDLWILYLFYWSICLFLHWDQAITLW